MRDILIDQIHTSENGDVTITGYAGWSKGLVVLHKGDLKDCPDDVIRAGKDSVILQQESLRRGMPAAE